MLPLVISDSKDEQYQIIDVLDVGSKSIIYSATRKNIPVTIKEYKHSTTTWIGIEEVGTLNKCKNPHIPIVYESWVSNAGKFRIAMEPMNRNFMSILPFAGIYIPNKEKSDYVKQLFEAVRDLHANKVVHFNLKPENIFLTEDNQLKLVDFELAETFENVYSEQFMTDFDKNKIIKATPSYRPPEGFLPSMDPLSINEKTDIWGIGCILWDMICPAPLIRPHTFDDEFNEVHKTYYDAYQRVQKLAETEHPFLKKMYSAILMCIAYDKYDRPTAQELLDFWN